MASKILITPNAGSTTVDPTIAFQGAGVTTDVTLRIPSTGGLSFEGTSGQLFSITDSMSGTIFSANDVSGIPSIEVLDTGLVKLAQYSGNVVLGSATDDGANKLQVNGSVAGTSFNSITGLSSTTPAAAGSAAVGTSTTVARADHVHQIQTTISGNAGTVTTNANLTGPVTSVGNATSIAAGAISNTMLANGAVANLSGTNSGDNAANTNYASDYRAANFVAGTNYLTPSGSAASLTSFPTLNQSTTGSSASCTGEAARAKGLNRSDSSSDTYNVQTHWGGIIPGYWALRGYNNTTYHAECAVGYASTAAACTGNAATATNVAWSGITSIPTTLSGYGITDWKYGNYGDIDLIPGNSGCYYFTSGTSAVIPGQSDGTVWYHAYPAAPTTWGSQLVQDYRTGRSYLRGRNNGAWSSWLTGLDSGNYNSYSPTLTGTGASGSWGINVTGNAATSTSAGYLTGPAHTNGSDGWFRSDGAAGWFNQSYAVGIYATEAGNVRTYNGANFIAAGTISGSNLSGTNTGDNAANTTYANDYRAANFVAGTNYLTPNGSAASLTSFPTLNQNTTGSAATATLAAKTSTLSQNGGSGAGMTFNWSGQGGQPNWLWGSNDGTNIYVYNPSNFSVNYASTAGSAAASSITTAVLGSGTANSSTYLRGDSTWAAVVGFSSADDTTTNATYYPAIITAAGGSTAKTSSTKLYFNPSTGTLSSTIFNSLSDINFKTNVVPLAGAINTIKQINGYSFDWKDGSGSSYGVIAQEIEKIIPNVVTQDNNQKSVNYMALIPFLIESVKQQQSTIESLELRITNLEDKLKSTLIK